jgi:hypothetical protein
MYSGRDLPKEGFPHSDIRGSTIARISPRLIAACHVLHRLLVPRHPLNALLILISHHRPHAGSIRTQGRVMASHVQSDSNATPRHSLRQGSQPCRTLDITIQIQLLNNTDHPEHSRAQCGVFQKLIHTHGGDRDRTDDPLLAKQALSR